MGIVVIHMDSGTRDALKVILSQFCDEVSIARSQEEMGERLDSDYKDGLVAKYLVQIEALMD